MRQEVRLYLNQRPELKQYVRIHPVWYRYLSRDPQALLQLESEVKQFYGRTFPQKLERFHSNLNMAMMLLEMARGFGASK
ncbi:hypothetical protein BKP45_19310 [Anaerobacillus alkalidiazotrophicus]|uniref:YlbE-like protein n=1 Tax=Anaerobacillus alkalidiazotrophicus TaxID=472963 RepID=A0A1S2LZP0_9BACI|nr:YlbE-like family protein [Anaerobacillus alkalidiazotrophicus]OIJ17720.1 hypothetical protein BKP45_19310 [Anaerobacillus alkalidiazotrophicus]